MPCFSDVLAWHGSIMRPTTAPTSHNPCEMVLKIQDQPTCIPPGYSLCTMYVRRDARVHREWRMEKMFSYRLRVTCDRAIRSMDQNTPDMQPWRSPAHRPFSTNYQATESPTRGDWSGGRHRTAVGRMIRNWMTEGNLRTNARCSESEKEAPGTYPSSPQVPDRPTWVDWMAPPEIIGRRMEPNSRPVRGKG